MPQKEWMLGLPGHNEVVAFDDVLLLVKGGQLRPTDLVKKLGEPWRAANEIPELAPHFAAASVPKPALAAAKTERAVAPEPAKAPVATSRLKRTPEPRPTGRVPRAGETRSAAETRPPAAAPRPSEAASEATTPVPRKIELPRPLPRPRPRLEPMVEKYFGPVDLLRCASFSFDPKKLLLSALLMTPLALAVAAFVRIYDNGDGLFRQTAGAAGLVTALLGFAFATLVLAYVTRRQIEGTSWTAGAALGYGASSAPTALVFPVVALIGSLLSGGLLWILGFVRNMGTGAASFLKIAYFIPMFFSLIAVLGVLVYQVACMYVPAAAAIEGQGLVGSVNAAWRHIASQWGRVVLHWLIVTVAFGVISAVCVGLAFVAVYLPEFTFRSTDDEAVLRAWRQFDVLFSLYKGLAFGLGMTLPASLFATLGTLSYCSLRTTAAGQLSLAAPDETSGGAWPSSRASPLEATQPGETRPSPDSSNPGGPRGTSPGMGGEISDDSDEHPLVS
jgi:hypothetical protein